MRCGIEGARGLSLVVALLLCSFGTVVAQLAPVFPDPGLPRPAGRVKGMGLQGNVAYIGGEFSEVALPPAYGARLDPLTGLASGPVPSFDRDITAAAPDGDGGWYVGGDFTFANYQPRAGLAHILPNGSLDPLWAPSVTPITWWIIPLTLVTDIAVSGNTVFVAGAFTTVNGAQRVGLAAIHAQTGALLPLNAGLSGGAEVKALLPLGSTLYFCGGFTSVQGVTRVGHAALDIASGTLLPWDPAYGLNEHLAAVPGGILRGGHSASGGGVDVVDTTFGNPIAGWNAGAIDAPVRTSALFGNTLYIGGNFTSVGGLPRSGVAALNALTGAPLPWTPALVQGNPWLEVLDMTVTSSTLYFGGWVSDVGGQPRSGVAALDTVTGQLAAWDPVPATWWLRNPATHPVKVLDTSGGEIFMGGSFIGIQSQARGRLAAVDVINQTILAWSPNADAPANDFAFINDTAYIAGDFTVVDGQPRAGLAAISMSTGALLPWDPAPDAAVTALATDGNVLYASGSFSSIGGQPRGRIAALDPQSGLAIPWDPDADAAVDALAVTASGVIAGGAFSTIGGQSRSFLAAIDSETGLATPWNPAPNAPVQSLYSDASTVFAGGTFTSMSGQVRSSAAEIDLQNGQATPWAPAVNAITFSGTPVFHRINTIVRAGPAAYVGGLFAVPGGPTGQLQKGLIETTHATGSLVNWNPRPHEIFALGLAGDRLVVGGQQGYVLGSCETGLNTYSLPGIAGVIGIAPPWSSTAPGPRLGMGRPVLGTTPFLRISQAPPSAPATLFVSLAPAPGPPILISGCPIHLDLPSLIAVVPPPLDANGFCSLPLAIPNLPGLAGFRVRSLAAIYNPGGAFTGSFELSNTVELLFGL